MLSSLKARAGVILASIGGAVLTFGAQAHAALITMPSSTEVMSGVETYSGPTFTEFLVIALAGVGIYFAGIVLAFLVGKLSAAGRIALGRRGRGGRRRRR